MQKKEEKRKQRRVDELIIAKDFRLDSFLCVDVNDRRSICAVKRETKEKETLLLT
mgnify:FL=1